MQLSKLVLRRLYWVFLCCFCWFRCVVGVAFCDEPARSSAGLFSPCLFWLFSQAFTVEESWIVSVYVEGSHIYTLQ